MKVVCKISKEVFRKYAHSKLEHLQLPLFGAVHFKQVMFPIICDNCKYNLKLLMYKCGWTWSGSGCRLLRYGAAAVNTCSISRSCRFRCTTKSPMLLNSSFCSLKSWVNLYEDPLSFFLLSIEDLVNTWHRGSNTCLKTKHYIIIRSFNKD